MTARNEDFLFAQEALAQGFVTEAQIQEGMDLQKRMASELELDERLAVILVKRGWLAEEQARRVYARLEPQGRRDQIPGYRLIEMIGRGAMGTVYKAIHLGLQRTVAIKVLRKDLATDPTQVGRLKEEARILASLDHKNVVRALDAGESNGFPYVVMEFVEGESLKDRISREGSLPEDVALKIARGLADALERARRMGVVHRDVKPGNVLLGRDGEPKLMDLGLAKGPVDLGLTQHGATVGTPQYISPEQAQDPRKADTRSDIYSLGATLYAMLTGRPPFEGSTLAEILTKVLYETPTPIRALNKTVSLETQYLVERMMLKDPTLRYRTPAEVVHDLDQIRGGVSIIPQGFAGSWEGFLLRRRARRTLAAIGITVGAAVVFGVGFAIFWNARQEREARERAERYVAAVLDQTVVAPEDDPVAVARKFDDVNDAVTAYLSFGPENAAALQARQAELQRVRADWSEWESMQSGLDDLRKAGDYPVLLARLDKFRRKVRERTPAHARALAMQRETNSAADQELLRLREEARLAPARTLGDLLATFRDLKRRIEEGLLTGDAARTALGRIDQVVATLETIDREVSALRSEHASEAVKARLEADDAVDLLPQLERKTGEVLAHVTRSWEPLQSESVPLSTVRELVRSDLAVLASGVHDAAKAWQVTVLKTIVESARSSDRERAQRAVSEEFDALADRLRRAGARDLADETTEAGFLARRGFRERNDRAEIGFAALRDKVYARLRDRDAQGIRESVERAEVDDQGWLRERIRGFKVLADGLVALDEQAITALQERRRPEVVRLRDGTEERRWDIQEVHPAENAVTVRPVRGGATGPRRKVYLRELETQSLLEIAKLADGKFPPLAHAVALLALVPAEDPLDLRPLLRSMQEVLADLREAGAGYVQQDLEQRYALYRKEQDDREDKARYELNSAEDDMRRKEWGGAFESLLGLQSETSTLHYTQVFDNRREEIARLAGIVSLHIADRKLQGFFPGAEITTDKESGVTGIALNFETTTQKKNFQRDLGRGWAVLEPFVPPEPVTPGGTNMRFHLLRGLEDDLVRDRPLSITSPFDPARRITIEFTLYTLSRPFFFAVDVDGLMTGVLSADPTSSAYKEVWRFPPGLIPTDRGEKAPEVDFYGRGRGVAFHAGVDFGEPERWDWPEASQGFNWQDWVEDPKKKKDLPPRLFAFQAERSYRVMVVRERGKLSLFVDGVEVASEEHPEWATRGLGSDEDPQVRGGSGRIQFLTWTPAAIDDFRMSGVVRKKWR